MILLDTCAIIWDALDQQQLSPAALKAINHADTHHELIIADISLWEIAMLIKKGRLEVPTTAANFLQLFLQSRNVFVIAISPEIAELSVSFGSDINNDPADRIIAATAIIQHAQLVTADRNLLNSGLVGMVW